MCHELQCTLDVVATLGHPLLATIYDWPLYPNMLEQMYFVPGNVATVSEWPLYMWPLYPEYTVITTFTTNQSVSDSIPIVYTDLSRVLVVVKHVFRAVGVVAAPVPVELGETVLSGQTTARHLDTLSHLNDDWQRDRERRVRKQPSYITCL